jgi:hypothetical protein
MHAEQKSWSVTTIGVDVRDGGGDVDRALIERIVTPVTLAVQAGTPVVTTLRVRDTGDSRNLR